MRHPNTPSVASVVSAIREAETAVPYARGSRFVSLTHSRLQGWEMTVSTKVEKDAWDRKTFVFRSPDGSLREVPAKGLLAFAKEVAK